MRELDISAYRPVFYPESIAVIGASNKSTGFGSGFLRTHLSYGYEGKLYPVNPRGGEIQGLKAYAKVDDIPHPVDFAVIAIPARFVPDAIRSCAKKGIKGAEILSSGFREAGPEGEALEREVVRIAREGGVKLVGPNCFGIHTPEARLTLLPGGDFSTTPGPVGLISQSGGGACDLVYMSQGRGLSFSVVISCGNSCGINAAEMLRYYEADPNTRLVGAYLEGVDDGREFFEALKSCARKKPVVIMKGGLSDQGYRGTMGHTGSMAGTRQAWDAAIKSAGAIAAHDMRDLVECLMAVNCLDGFIGGGAGILAGGGARVVEGLDAASKHGFPVPMVRDEIAARIGTFLPPVGGKGGNPVDLANPGITPETLSPIMDILADEDDIDFLLMYQMLFYMFNTRRRMPPEEAEKMDFLAAHRAVADKAEEIRGKSGKPLALVLIDTASNPDHSEIEAGRLETRSYYTSRNIPCFDTGLQAFSVLRRVADYYAKRGKRD